MASPGEARILRIESLAFRAWPAAEVREAGGWRLRFNHGVTGRANSVWPNRLDGATDLPDRLAAVEAFYAERGLPARYQLCPVSQPAGLDAALARRSYRASAPTCVQVCDLRDGEPTTATAPHLEVVVPESPTEGWFEVAARGAGYDAVTLAHRKATVARIAAPAGHALALRAGRPVAVSRVVVEDGWAGLFDVATLPEARRTGAARALLAACARWARDRGARALYLQVESGNRAALALYGNAGFRTLYRYHYRVGP